MAFVDEVSPEIGLLGSVGGMVSGVTPILSAVGGLSSMFGSGASSDIARASGTFYTGEMSGGSGKQLDTSTLIIVAVIVLSLLFVLKRKK